MHKPESAADPVRMWWVSRPDGGGGHLFAGDLQSAVQHINDLHRQTGLQHATQEVCVEPSRDPG
jgi:hypothetical protein